MNSQKIKVGFFLRNQEFPNLDARFPEKGNPGTGGTTFTKIATAYYLDKFYSDKVEILFFAEIVELLPPSLKVYHAINEIDAAVKSEREGCDIFVFTSQWQVTPETYDELCKLNIKIIVRSTNILDVRSLNKIADCSQIKAYICTGHEQLDIWRDHRVFEKSTLIFDLFNTENFVPKKDILKQSNTVVFLGNFVHYKGFHHLARVWPDIIKQRPDAKLIAIGSAKLYDRSTKLGKWGIAEENYEGKYIRPFLADENGNILKSVHFPGLLGAEKVEILQNADVGVINPSGVSEVCPASALEISACGTPVVSAAKWGVLDTVVHRHTGLLGKNDRDLTRNILYLLNNPPVAKQFGENGINFVRDKFSPQLITKQWLDLFIDICNDRSPQPQPIKQNYLYEAKFLKEGMRILKKYVPPLQAFPPLFEVTPLLKRYIKKRLPKKALTLLEKKQDF
jgi:glycosyltransferase involved in cell wall biosynthesis